MRNRIMNFEKLRSSRKADLQNRGAIDNMAMKHITIVLPKLNVRNLDS